MKKLLFALPFLLFSVAGCSYESTIGRVSKLKYKDIVSITLNGRSKRETITYTVLDEKVEETAKKLLGLRITVVRDPCKCDSPYKFTITTASDVTYRFGAYSFTDNDKYIYYTTTETRFSELVNYTIERSNITDVTE